MLWGYGVVAEGSDAHRRKEQADMDSQTVSLLNTLLILLVVLLQFVLHAGPQSQRVQELERRLEQAEQTLEDLQLFLKR